MRYKRNQVEEAISRLLDPKSLRSTQDLRTKVKRLLDTDRALPPSAEQHNAKFAFFGTRPTGERDRELVFSLRGFRAPERTAAHGARLGTESGSLCYAPC